MSVMDDARFRRRSLTAAAAASLGFRVRAVLCAIRAWWEARAAARHLQALSDEQLRDIGIQRGQIEFLVRGHAVPWTRDLHAEH
jgi:uncharacterized protein YjiS (DUF1127 family)